MAHYIQISHWNQRSHQRVAAIAEDVLVCDIIISFISC